MQPEQSPRPPTGDIRRAGLPWRDILTVAAVGVVLAVGGWFYLQERGEGLDAGDTASLEGEPGEAPELLGDGPPVEDPDLDAEARAYVETLTRPEPLSVTDADKFVRRDQVISLLPPGAVESVRLGDLLEDPALAGGAPVTIVRETEQLERATAERLGAEAGLELGRRFRLQEGGQARETTARELLSLYATDPKAEVEVLDAQGNAMRTPVESLLREAGLDPRQTITVLEGDQPTERAVVEVLPRAVVEPVTVVRKVEEYTITTTEELRTDARLKPEDTVRVVRQPFGLASTTVGELMMDAAPASQDTVFYVRTVRDSDRQGLWGIVQEGLIENFGRGVALNRGEDFETYRVDIPSDADERLDSRESSFLGRVIHRKTAQTYVYNFAQGRMGRNPDMVRPGQELVIIQFPAEELVDIYKHFAKQGAR